MGLPAFDLAPDGDQVLLAQANGTVVAYDAADLALEWSANLTDASTAPTAAGSRVFVGTAGGWVRAYDRATGKPAWAARTGGPIVAAATAGGGPPLLGGAAGSPCARTTPGG